MTFNPFADTDISRLLGEFLVLYCTKSETEPKIKIVKSTRKEHNCSFCKHEIETNSSAITETKIVKNQYTQQDIYSVKYYHQVCFSTDNPIEYNKLMHRASTRKIGIDINSKSGIYKHTR